MRPVNSSLTSRLASMPVMMLAWALTAATIPATRGTTLSGASVNLPADLGSKTGILVLGFSRESAIQTKAWSEATAKVFGANPQVAYFSAAVLADAPGFIRGIVVRGLRSQIPTGEQDHFLPILRNGAEWKTAVHFAAPDDAYVLVLDGNGNIRWITHGPAQPESLKQLEACVARSRSSGTAGRCS